MLLVAAGPDIMKLVDQFLVLIEDLKQRNVCTSSTSFTGSFVDDVAAAHPEISALCETADCPEAPDDATSAMAGETQASGVFRDLVGHLIRNPEDFIKWFNIVKDLFGLEEMSDSEEADGEAEVEAGEEADGEAEVEDTSVSSDGGESDDGDE